MARGQSESWREALLSVLSKVNIYKPINRKTEKNKAKRKHRKRSEKELSACSKGMGKRNRIGQE